MDHVRIWKPKNIHSTLNLDPPSANSTLPLVPGSRHRQLPAALLSRSWEALLVPTLSSSSSRCHWIGIPKTDAEMCFQDGIEYIYNIIFNII